MPDKTWEISGKLPGGPSVNTTFYLKFITCEIQKYKFFINQQMMCILIPKT